MGTDLASAPPYQGNPAASYTSVDEANAGQGAEGQAAPTGTTAVAITAGDTLSGLMEQAGLDWNNPEHREQFLADNPQFADTGGRNPDLIWPGEVVYIRTAVPQNGAVQTSAPDGNGQATFQNYQGGKPVGEPYQAVPGQHGQPANAETFDPAGNPITTDQQGNARNGYFWVDGDSRGNARWVRYEDGARTQDSFLTSPYDDIPDPSTDPQTGALDLATDANGVALNGPVTRTQDNGDGTYQVVTDTYVNGVRTATERGQVFS